MNRFVLLLLLWLFSCADKPSETGQTSVKEVMDQVITRLYSEVPSETYATIDDAFMLNFVTNEEKEVLATQYQYFTVNVPARVSLMRSKSQEVVPFWMENSGFVKTAMTVQNDNYEYEFWQRNFDKGIVNLGINGFDMHRVVYFICVCPQKAGDVLEISDYYPEQYSLEKMQKGAFTYHDWSSLLITELPDELVGQTLFTTVRGRAREAHVKGGFRTTPFPSTEFPDQALLTWSAAPENSIDIQWRTSSSVPDGIVKYWKKDASDTQRVVAAKFVMEDRMLYNDRYVNRFTASLSDLEPGTNYGYIAGSEQTKTFTEVKYFQTQSAGQNGFSFVWFGDTHKSPVWGELLQKAHEKHPEVAFYSIAGDLVSTGLYRNEWDELFAYSGDVFAQKPLMSVPGNHDRQDGLGSWMYYEMFSLPKNGPQAVAPESTYAFRYGNALFLMIDSTHPNEEQTDWIGEQLSTTDAVWKFVFFHFPPYNYEEPYPDIQAAWVPLFDKYHVDMVMSGHEHYYMRTRPMKNGQEVDTFADGTVYTISIGIDSRHDEMGEEPYAEVRYGNGPYYQHMEINDKVLTYTAYNKAGEIKDNLVISKP
jgi:acid phosphatase type 7